MADDELELDAQDELFFGEGDLAQDLKIGRISRAEYDRRLERLRERARREYYGS